MNLDESDRIASELRSAVAILTRHKPASVTFRLLCDRAGVVRLVLEHIEGVPLTALAADDVSEEGQ